MKANAQLNDYPVTAQVQHVPRGSIVSFIWPTENVPRFYLVLIEPKHKLNGIDVQETRWEKESASFVPKENGSNIAPVLNIPPQTQVEIVLYSEL